MHEHIVLYQYIKQKKFTVTTLMQLVLSFNVNKNPTDATVCRYLFTAKLLYMFRVSQHPSSGVLKTVPAVPNRPRWRGVAVQVV